MEVIYLAGLILLSIIGIIGCFLPVLPGPPISFLAMWLYSFMDSSNITVNTLWIWLIVSLLVTVLDYFIPLFGTKKFGGTKYGIYGAGLGLILGIFFFPPFGIIIGPFAGAYLGEIINGKESAEAWKAAFGSFIGFIAGTFVKVIASSAMLIIIIYDRI